MNRVFSLDYLSQAATLPRRSELGELLEEPSPVFEVADMPHQAKYGG